MMKIVSVNVSLPREVKWMGKLVSTGIFKEPVRDRLKVTRMNIEGDRQADLTAHGGANKAIYAYAAEHYAPWMRELSGRELPWGMFGENLTIEGGLFEDDVFVGDRFKAGTAELIAIQPRLPCYKLGIRFGTQRIVRHFAKSGRYGIYFRVLAEGSVGLNDPVERIAQSTHKVSIGDVGRLLLERDRDPLLLKRAIEVDCLPENLRREFESLLKGSNEGT